MTHPDTAPVPLTARRPMPRDVKSLDDLRPPVPVTDLAFAVAVEVYDAAAHLYLEVWTDEDGVDRGHCPRCDRGLIAMHLHYTADDRVGLVVAHMIQSHGWTRESTGE